MIFYVQTSFLIANHYSVLIIYCTAEISFKIDSTDLTNLGMISVVSFNSFSIELIFDSKDDLSFLCMLRADSFCLSWSLLNPNNLLSISLLDRLKTEIFSMNPGMSESVSSICYIDLSVSLTDTEPDCIPLRVDKNIRIINFKLESTNTSYGFVIKSANSFFSGLSSEET